MLKRELEQLVAEQDRRIAYLKTDIERMLQVKSETSEKHRQDMSLSNNMVDVARVAENAMAIRLGRRERELAKSRRNSAALQDTLVLLTVKHTVGKDLEVVE